ncbi:MAG: hypothetical protein PHW63_09350 [Alphaproteobacteria bacterium]|nr:hypothetical protein [Alphaproteobacteria bacterium]
MKRLGDYTMGFARVSIGAFSQVGGVIFKALLPAIGAALAGLAIMAGQALIGGILALGGAIGSVAQGALLMAPALVAAAGISFAVLKIGLEGVQEGVSAAFSAETVEEFEEAIAGLPASVQSVAWAYREFKPAMDEMKRAVQDNLLDGLAPGITSSMNNLFPAISSGMQRVATEWNGALKGALGQLSSAESKSGMEVIMENVVQMAATMQPVLANLIAGFGSLAEQGSNYLVPIGQWLTDISQKFRDWTQGLREVEIVNGQVMTKFDGMMERAKTNLGYLSAIFGGLLGGMWNILKAGSDGGETMLAGMAAGMQRFNDATKEGTEGYDKIVLFMKDATDMASQLGLLFGPVAGIIMSISSTLMKVAETALPGIVVLAGALETSLQPINKIAEEFGDNLSNAFVAISPAVERLGTVVAPLIDGIGKGIEALFVSIGPSLTTIMEGLMPVALAFAPLFEKAGTAIGDIFNSFAPIMVSSFGVLEKMAPILGDVFHWIGVIGSKLLDTIAPLLTEHDEAIMKLLDNIRPLIGIIGEGLLKILDFIAPYVSLISAAFGVLVNAIASMIPYILPITEFFMNVLAHSINILLPLAGIVLGVVAAFKIFGLAMTVFNTFKTIISAVRGVWILLSLAFSMSPIGFVITLVAALVGGLIYFFTQTETGKEIWARFTQALSDGWQKFATKMSEIWDWIQNVIFARIVFEIGKLQYEWDRFTYMLGSLWSDLGTGLGLVWDWIKRTIFDKVPGMLDSFKRNFTDIVNDVKGIWNGLRETFARPIEFLLSTVINGGLVAGWNKIMSFINKDGKDGNDNWSLSPVNVDSALKFKTGGVLPGYTPGKDVHKFLSPTGGALHLSGGEAIMRPEWTRAVGGPKAVEEMNAAARHGRIAQEVGPHDKRTQAFAGGGVVDAMINIVKQKYPGLTMTSGYENRPGMHGQSLATDWSNGGGNTPMQLALAQDITSTYPGSKQLIYQSPGFMGNLGDGQNVGNGLGYYGAGTMSEHQNHVHWGMTKAPNIPFGGGVFEGGSDGGGNSSGGGWQSIMGAGVSKLLSTLIDPLKGKMEGFAEPLGQYGKLAIGFADGLIDKSVQVLREKVASVLPAFGSGGGGGNADWEPGAGAEQWRGMLIKAFQHQGEEPKAHLVDALVRQIWSESKGDPNVAQQIVDENGTGESAGVGLAQFIPGTWDAYRDPTLPNNRRDPWAHTNAMVRYARDRHGFNTAGFGNGIGWSTGGVLPDFFDQGGVASGIGAMAKNVIAPERVLSPAQTVAFNDFVYGFMPELVAQIKANPTDLKGHEDRHLQGFDKSQMKASEFNARRVEKLVPVLTKVFDMQRNGQIKTDRVDFDINGGWWDRNGSVLTKNFSTALKNAKIVLDDPWGYLEAEKKAKEALEKIDEENATKASEEANKARQEAQKAEIDAAASDEEKEAIRERHQAEMEGIQERESAEKAVIDEKKKTGEYYYGYKTFGDDGSNPNEYEASDSEKKVMATLNALAAPLGLEGPMGKISEKLPVLQSLGSAVQTATPAWMAAAGGDMSGLNHNIAAATTAAHRQRSKEFEDMGPGALAGLVEMAMSTSALGAQQPFIGTVNSGMSQAEFLETMDKYEAKRSRQGGGTIRTR